MYLGFGQKTNNGFCLLPSCSGKKISEVLNHVLSCCGSLDDARNRLLDFTNSYSKQMPIIKDLINQCCNTTHSQFSQFLINCSCLPPVISAAQLHGDDVLHHLYSITWTWYYSLHRYPSETPRKMKREVLK